MKTVSVPVTTETAPAASLQSHCLSCVKSCCHNNAITITAKEHQDIIDKVGAANDHFYRVDLGYVPKTYYVLEYRNGPCPYWAKDQGCTVNEIKPLVCRVFPAQYDFLGSKIITSHHCPAHEAFAENKTYMKEAKKMLPAFLADFSRNESTLAKIACQEFEDGRKPTIKATVTPPPALQKT